MNEPRFVWPAAILMLALLGPAAIAAPVKPPENPAKITISVAPDAVAPGGQAEVTVTIDPISGVKINRYPQIKLQVPDQEGLVDEAEIRIGSKTPLPLDGSNFWKHVDPVQLSLTVDADAASGEHEVEAKLTYYYCLSGNFCAPKRVAVSIPLDVE